MSKTYKFTNAEGADVERTLAKATPKRLRGLLEHFGMKGFGDLVEPEKQQEYGLLVMDTVADTAKVETALEIVLEEGSKGIDCENCDATIMAGAIQDFFEQVPKMFRERMSN